MLSVTTKQTCSPCTPVDNPCYTEPVVSEFEPCYADQICNDGCEESYNAKCVVVKVDLPHLGTFTGSTLEAVLTKINDVLNELLPQVNKLIANPIYNYHYNTTCYSSVTVKRNGITLLSATDFADKDAMLTYLQGVDHLWEWDSNIFKIASIHQWEITSSC